MSVNTLFNSSWYPLMEFGFFCAVGFAAGSMGLI